MRILVRTFLVLVLAGANVCSIWLSASATIARFESAHVPHEVSWAAVPMLEFVSVAGAIGMVAAAGWVLRGWSIGLVTLVMVSTAIAGFDAYGWVGLLAPIMIQGTAHALDFACRDPLRVGRAHEQAERTPWLAPRWARAKAWLARSAEPVEPVVPVAEHVELSAPCEDERVVEREPSDPIERARSIDERSGIERTDEKARAEHVAQRMPATERQLSKALGITQYKAREGIRAAREPIEEAS